MSQRKVNKRIYLFCLPHPQQTVLEDSEHPTTVFARMRINCTELMATLSETWFSVTCSDSEYESLSTSGIKLIDSSDTLMSKGLHLSQ